MKLVIIDYGAGNVFSVKSAFERLGVDALLTRDKDEILSADRVVFPGVGHATAALKQLRESRLDTFIPALQQPVLGVCLGMQLMCEHTEEGNEMCLGIFDGVDVKRFEGNLKIPHMGWNSLLETSHKLEGLTQDVYFVHSYFAPVNPYTVAVCQYGQPFSAAMEKNNFFACQFHPEKSGAAGELILKRFLNA
jgi:glutamine amidotransferase